MEIKRVMVNLEWEDGKTAEYIDENPPKAGKYAGMTIFQIAKKCLKSVGDSPDDADYFGGAKISAKNDPDIFTSADYPEMIGENEKMYSFHFWGEEYDACVEVEIIAMVER